MGVHAAFDVGGFRFEPAEERLVEGGRIIRLTPKASETLYALVTRPGTVVTKDELFAAVWPGLTVEENNLNQQISALRKALTANGHSVVIETVPRRGYRLLGPVREIVPAPPDAALPPAAPAAGTTAALAASAAVGSRMRVWLGLGLAAIALTGAAGFLWGRSLTPAISPSDAALNRGNELLRQGNGAGAAAEFQTAIRLDERNARAYGALAQALNRAYDAPSSAVRPVGQSPSVEAARRAVALDPRCAECQGTLGFFLFYHDWLWAEADTHLRTAIQLAPDNESIRPSYAIFLAATGRLAEAEREIDAALEKRPYEVGWHLIKASIVYFDRRYDAALASADQALRLVTAHSGGWESRSKALFQLERGPEALHALSQGPFAQHSTRLDEAVTRGGTAAGLRELLLITDDWRGRVEHSWRRAQWRTLAGDVDGALDELERATAMRRLNAIYFGVEPVYDPIRDHPRFHAVLDKLGLPQLKSAGQ